MILLFNDMLYMLVRVCESKWSYVLEVPDVDFIRPCGHIPSFVSDGYNTVGVSYMYVV